MGIYGLEFSYQFGENRFIIYDNYGNEIGELELKLSMEEVESIKSIIEGGTYFTVWDENGNNVEFE